MTEPNAIETHCLTRRFGKVEAVSDLTLEVPAGSIYGLLGPNGAGKSTTIRMLLDILRPTSGSARVLGIESSRLRPTQLRQIGYLAEDQDLPDWMTLRRLLEYCRPMYPTWDQALMSRLLDLFALPLTSRLGTFSRGMRMKARMLLALVHRPRLLLLDEPFGGLDPMVREELVEGLLELGSEGSWAVLISSHEMSAVEKLADRVGFLHQGRLLLSEEMEMLRERFRKVEVVCESTAHEPEGRPESWLRTESAGAVFRFVAPYYLAAEVSEQVRDLFPDMRELNVEPMSLQDIFITVLRGQRPIHTKEPSP